MFGKRFLMPININDGANGFVGFLVEVSLGFVWSFVGFLLSFFSGGFIGGYITVFLGYFIAIKPKKSINWDFVGGSVGGFSEGLVRK